MFQSNGNISSKTDVGNYSYHTNKKNAVVKVTDPNNTISTFGQTITYTPFNSVKTILENNQQLTFTYGPDQQRRKMEYLNGGTLQKTNYYIGNYEKIVTATNDVTELHYIAGGDGLAAIHVITTPNTQSSTHNTFYTYTDYQGSILALTDEAGTVVLERNFDAWGRLRNVDDWSYIDPSPLGGAGGGFSWLTRGYTGHEHLPPLSGGAGVGSLINMNGRMYDPLVARMLSPDNYVQSPFNTQSYNRYSYVINNPLKYTDPSGENWEDVARGFIDAVGFLSGYKFLSEGVQILNDKINGVERKGGYFNLDYLTGQGAPGYVQGGGLGRPSNMSNDWSVRDGAQDASGATIDMDAMNQEALDRYFMRRLSGGINLPMTTIEALRGDPRGVQASWDEFLEQSGGSCPNCLNPNTVGQNIGGLTYPGGDNPRSYNGNYNYSYVPTNMSEYPAIGHDRRYDNLNITGASGLFLDPRAIGADWKFVGEELSIAANPAFNATDRFSAGALGVGLGIASFTKTMLTLGSGGYNQVMMWYNISNVGVTNRPTPHNH